MYYFYLGSLEQIPCQRNEPWFLVGGCRPELDTPNKPLLCLTESQQTDCQSSPLLSNDEIMIICAFNWFPGQVLVTAIAVGTSDHQRASSMAAHLNTYIYVWLTRNNDLRKSLFRNPLTSYRGVVVSSPAHRVQCRYIMHHWVSRREVICGKQLDMYVNI